MISVNERDYILHLQKVNQNLTEALKNLLAAHPVPKDPKSPAWCVIDGAKEALSILQSESNVSQA